MASDTHSIEGALDAIRIEQIAERVVNATGDASPLDTVTAIIGALVALAVVYGMSQEDIIQSLKWIWEDIENV